VAPIATVHVTAAGDASQCADAVAVIAVTRANRAELLALAEGAESAGAAGVQIIWDGRPRVCEGAVFRVLEAWRGAARRCPLVLAPDVVPAPELLRAIARRKAAAAPGDAR
jgi:hypothetical protein